MTHRHPTNLLTIVFTAIDHCIEIKRPNGDMESRCDAMIICGNKIIFIELKERNGNGWEEKGESQLRTIIHIFSQNHSFTPYDSKVAYIANKLKPGFVSSRKKEIQKFKDETGFTLRITNKIIVS
jgi:hypothetical protein